MPLIMNLSAPAKIKMPIEWGTNGRPTFRISVIIDIDTREKISHLFLTITNIEYKKKP